MTFNVYCFYDDELKKEQMPFIADSDSIAIRQFMLAMKSVPVEVRPHLFLYKLGYADIYSGDDPISCEFSIDDGFISSGLDFDTWQQSHTKKEDK